VPSLARSVPKPLKVPSLARSVQKPLKVPSLARSVPKPLKVPSLARSVPKPLKVGQEGGEGEVVHRYVRPLTAILCFVWRSHCTQ
jgi:hypothetical protein